MTTDDTTQATIETDGRITDSPYSEYTDDDETVRATVTATVERCDFYDDGRTVVQLAGEVETDDGTQTLEHVSRETYFRIGDNHSLSAPVFDTDGGVLETLRRRVLDARDAQYVATIDAIGASVTVDSRSERGRGEGHERLAEGRIVTDDGRSLGVTWRNAVDIGHQVFTDDDTLGDFDGEETDALVHFAIDNSPITRAMRM